MSKFLLIIMFVFVPVSITVIGQENSITPEIEMSHESDELEEHAELHESGEHAEHQEHHTNTNPLLFVILAVIIGGLTRFFLKKSPIPFTVALLLIGIGLGALGRFDLLHSYTIGSVHLDVSFFDEAIDWAAHIDPHMLLYVFLPILIFEAAFAMDVHIFKKVAGNASILAIPGIITAMLLTAGMIASVYYFGWGLEGWNWEMAMLFGAVVSATDPVAVVSILKELGASKKLGALIEGESLLNDGTAIVIFMVILGSITGLGSDVSPILVFFKVALGGILVGGVIGWIIIKWIKRVFNDMLVEISAIVGAAYLTFFIAENFLGVSGVLALVTFGLIMSSVGRTRISPEVQHFLHKFWELTAFLANVLIFLIVGVVITVRTVCTVDDFLLLGLIYIGVFIVRAIVISMFFPVMKRTGYGINKKDAVVMWWGALRGAIGLALALIVAGNESIPQGVRDQFLFLTAGIVTLTLLVNATTMKVLVNKLGMLKISSSKQVVINNANEYIHQSTENVIERLKKERYLKRSNWKKVKQYLPEEVHVEVDKTEELDYIQESRRRILEKEKSSYWKQFKDGLLEPESYQILVSEINEIIDSKGDVPLSQREDIEKLFATPKYLTNKKISFLSRFFERALFNRMTISYDSARGFVDAQEDCLKLLQSMMRSSSSDDEAKQLEILQKEIEENQIIGMTYLRNIGKEYPEIYNAISTRKSIRTVLNYEKHTIQRLNKNGRLTDDEAAQLIKGVEKRMKKLRDEKVIEKDLSEKEAIHDFAWLSKMSYAQQIIINQSQVVSYLAEDVIFSENDPVTDVLLIVRGSVELVQNNHSMVLGESNILGNIGKLENEVQKGKAVAMTPVTAIKIAAKDLSKLLNEDVLFRERLWDEVSRNLAFLYLHDKEPFNRYSKSKLRKEISKGKVMLVDNEEINLFNNDAILVQGDLYGSLGVETAPCQLSHTKYKSEDKSVIFIL